MKWFWTPVIGSSLFPLMHTMFSPVSGVMLTALFERWHEKIINFHMPVGEMTVMLDDVMCLLHILMEGKMMAHEDNISKECDNQFDAFISIPFLNKIYKEHLSMTTQLENVDGREEEER